MISAFRATSRSWLLGLALAALGVLIARVVAPGLDSRAGAACALTGQLLALAGLLVIALGIRRRLRSVPALPSATAD